MKSVQRTQTRAKYQNLIDSAVRAGAVATAVVYPCDEVSLKGAVEAARLKLITPILVGPTQLIQEVAGQFGVDLDDMKIVDAANSRDAATQAVALVRNGEAEALMKGSLHTDEVMSAVVARETRHPNLASYQPLLRIGRAEPP